MNKKIVIQFTALTFVIRFVFGGGVVICEQLGFMLNDYTLLYVPFLISAWSPAIASLIVLRKNNEVSSIKEWLRNIFNIKTSAFNYLFVVALLIVYMVSMLVTSGLNSVSPIYMFFIWLLASLLAGAGMEEAGWRYILQPELEKKFGYLLSCLIVAPIHILWHIPLGVGTSFLWNLINIFGITFALGAIYKISRGNIFLCVLFHCMINAGMSTIMPNQTTLGVIITSIIMISVSITVVSINKHIKS
ncbi:CPBP family intramembrane glutamic endopeptidase [Anaerosporobacter sp.]|uniref:CPBP family intramembrane glutamic endopeptidase n=1 Tax=Anaerosporobacter sp. TaxID=1872529 RepID=UPI00286EF2EC|nr:CPBP family intramembrane glutamic endopeptidase [Anaerosporobacter sp.]